MGTRTFPLNTPIAAIARREDHIDLFAVGHDRGGGTAVYTAWWDGAWHEWQKVSNTNANFPLRTPIAAIARREDHIDLFAVGDFIADNGTTVTTVCTAWWDGSWHEWGRVSDTNDAFPRLTPIAAIARHQEHIDLFGIRQNDEIEIRGVTKPVYSVYSSWWSDSWRDWAPIGGNLRITPTERQTVVGEVQQGLRFLANEEPKANVSFVYDFQYVEVNAAPGDTSDYESAEAPWRNAALQKMGFAASRQGSVDYVQQLRQKKGTDWAYVGYFTKYQLHHFGYAGDERICMEYANDGWGPSFINGVFAHETCHIFGAADEYAKSNCVCGERNGHLSVPNNNCVNCSGAHVQCLMDQNTLTLCRWTQGQIGWGDPLLGFTPNTPITSLARMPEHIDVFAGGTDGAVYTTWWDGSWHNWGQVGNGSGLFPAQPPVAAITRRADHIDLFAVGDDGRVYTNWWHDSWQDWGTVGNQTFPKSTPIAAIARKSDHIDLFAVGPDGRVYTNWWGGSWHEWGTVGNQTFPKSTPIAAIARREDHIDLFAVGQDGAGGTAVYTAWWDGSWHDWRKVRDTHDAFPLLTPVTALARKSDHIDLFAVGTDGLVHTNWWDGSWHEWGTVANSVFTQRTPVAAIARKSDHIDLFAVGQNGLVLTNWWGGSWHDWGIVDNDVFTQLTPVAAIARKREHIDLFVVGTDGAVYTNWWSDSWHEWAPISNRSPTFRLTTTQLPAIDGTQGQVPGVSALLLGDAFIYATHYYVPDFFQPSVQPGELGALDRRTLTPVKRVTVGKAPHAIALYQATNHLYVVNYQDVSVSVIDAAQFTVVDTLKIPGFGMISIAVSQKYHRIFATQPGQKRMIVIDAKTRTLGDPMIELALNGAVVVDEATDRLYTLVKKATDETLQEVVEFEINAQGQKELRRTTLDGQVSRPSGMAVDANRLYVINKDPQINPPLNHQKLTILNRSSLAVVSSVPLNSRSGMGVATSVAQKVIYVTTQYHIQVFDAGSLKVLQTIPLTAYQSDPYQPQGAVAVDEPTGVAYFGGAGSSTLVRHVYLPS